MKTLLLLLALVAGHVQAATVPMSAPTGVTHSSGAWTTASNFVGSFSGASFNNTFSTNVAGRAVTVPAAQRLAANAGQFAAQAVRLNPLGLLGAAVAAWLLTKGIEWIDGQWKKRDNSDDGSPLAGKLWYHNAPNSSCTVASPCSWSSNVADWESKYCSNDPTNCGGVRVTGAFYQNGAGVYSAPIEYYYKPYSGWYPAGTTTFYSTGTAQPSYIPAQESDFNQLAGPLPDAVANELANKSALPLENPQYDQPYQDVPLSEPKVDPVTGEKYRDAARVTPSEDGTSADVDPYKEPLDEEGEPIPDPEKPGETKKEATQNQDPCKTATNRLGCLDKGEADDIEIEKQNQGQSISPVSVGGGGSCPADRSISLSHGQATFSYQPICQLATMINPLVIAFAWLSAGFILIGAFRE